MELLKNFHAIDLSLLIGDTLIISDVHIGFEEALNKQGVFVPRDNFPQLIKRMEMIFERIAAHRSNKGKSNDGKNTAGKTKAWKFITGNLLGPKQSIENGTTNEQNSEIKLNGNPGKKLLERIIINGDLKHEFGTISDQEWRHTLKFLDFLGKHCEKIVLIKGNHDKVLGPIAQKRSIEIHNYYIIEDTDALVCHGDKLPDATLLKKAKLVIIGHEHPSIALRSGKRVEKYKCFYVGKYKGKNLIVLPSLNLLTEGSALMHEDVLSPFLRQDVSDFLVFAVEDKIYPFGNLGNLRRKEMT